MKSEQKERLFDQLFIMPLKNIERLKSWMVKKLGEDFPDMSFSTDNNRSFGVDLQVSAFQLQDTKI